MYCTGPATIALTEHQGCSLWTSHHRDKRDLVRNLLRHRDFFALIAEEFAEAKQIWDKEAEEDARQDRRRAEHRAEHGPDCECDDLP